MAWSDPVTLNTNELVTESHWNSHVNDLVTLRTGGLAISGQDTGCIPYASSPTQLAMSANLAFDGSSLVIAEAADNTGLVVSATTTNRPRILLQNAASGVLAAIQAENDGQLRFYTHNDSAPVLTLAAGPGGLEGGLSIGAGAVPASAGCLNVEGRVIGIPYAGATDGILIASTGGGSNITFYSKAGGTGSVYGPFISIGRNTSGDGAAGFIELFDRVGQPRSIWIDAAATVRTSTTPPEEDGNPSDTGGAVVGGQTSWHALKTNIVPTEVTPAEALQIILDTPIFDFEYPGGSFRDGDDHPIVFTGFVGYDRNDWFLTNAGTGQIPALDEVTIPGYYALAFKALAARIAALEAA